MLLRIVPLTLSRDPGPNRRSISLVTRFRIVWMAALLTRAAERRILNR